MNRKARKEVFYSRIGHHFQPSNEFKIRLGKYLFLPFREAMPAIVSSETIKSVIKEGLSLKEDPNPLNEYMQLTDKLGSGAPEENE
jgi:hypothetical protein